MKARLLFRTMFRTMVLMGLLCLPIIFASCKKADQKNEGEISIATGQITGVYYLVGSNLCRYIKSYKKSMNEDFNCFARPTPASVYNLNILRKGEVKFAFSQADTAYFAHLGQRDFKDAGSFENLRVVLRLYDEAYTVIVRRDSNIKSFEEIAGHVVNAGAPGSGMRAIFDQLKVSYGWDTKTFRNELDLKSSEQAQKLCDGTLDVMTYTIGHPNAAVQTASATCPVEIVSLNTPQVQALANEYPFYKMVKIPASLYPTTQSGKQPIVNGDSVETLGMQMLLMTTANTSDEDVKTLLDSVFRHFDTFKDTHGVLKNLTPEGMLSDGPDLFGIPYHSAVLKYKPEVHNKEKVPTDDKTKIETKDHSESNENLAEDGAVKTQSVSSQSSEVVAEESIHEQNPDDNARLTKESN